MAAVITITNKGTDYFVTVNGRATFEHAPQLRSLAKTLENAAYTSINVDLGQCTGMDSTFMGILSMLGLNARKIGVTMTIFNAGDANKDLLFGLGLKKLFQYKDEAMETGENGWESGENVAKGMDAHTVLEAHQTLMDVDEGNVKKFEKVVEMVQKDIEKKG